MNGLWCYGAFAHCLLRNGFFDVAFCCVLVWFGFGLFRFVLYGFVWFGLIWLG